VRNLGSCGFCDAPAVARCEWPVPRFVMATYADLKVGDHLQRGRRGSGEPESSVVEDIEPVYATPDAEFSCSRKIVLHVHDRHKEVIVSAFENVRVERDQPCLMPVCELHLRSVHDGVEYCESHWHSWESVA